MAKNGGRPFFRNPNLFLSPILPLTLLSSQVLNLLQILGLQPCTYVFVKRIEEFRYNEIFNPKFTLQCDLGLLCNLGLLYNLGLLVPVCLHTVTNPTIGPDCMCRPATRVATTRPPPRGSPRESLCTARVAARCKGYPTMITRMITNDY